MWSEIGFFQFVYNLSPQALGWKSNMSVKMSPQIYTYTQYTHLVGTSRKPCRRSANDVLKASRHSTLWGQKYCPHKYDSPNKAGV